MVFLGGADQYWRSSGLYVLLLTLAQRLRPRSFFCEQPLVTLGTLGTLGGPPGSTESTEGKTQK
jgi:hypothetical protein